MSDPGERRKFSAPGPAAPGRMPERARAPRVCILLESITSGGVESVAVTQCRGLLAAGCEVDLLRLTRTDWLLPRIPDRVRTMLAQEAAHPGKTAFLFSSASSSGPRKRFIDLSPRRRRLRLALDALHHLREAAFTRDGLRTFLRILKLNRRAPKERRGSGVRFMIRSAYFASCAVSLSRYIERVKPDCALFHLGNRQHRGAADAAHHCAQAAPGCGFSRQHERGSLQYAHGGKLALLSALLPEADAAHSVSAGLADEAARMCNIDRAAITVLHNPAFHNELSDLKQQGVDHPWIARKGEEGEEKTILWAGRMDPAKDLPTMLRAFQILCERRRARLILLGVPKKWGGETALRLAGEVKDRIACPGFVWNPFPWMAGADVFVLSSRYGEGLPGVLIEAIACGCPAVSTDCPHGPREILEDGRWGRLTPVGDARALAEAIDKTLENPQPAEELIARARDFSEDRIMPRFMEMLGVLPPAAGALPAAGAPSAAGASSVAGASSAEL